LLPDGRVLVAGGLGADPYSTAELYDPATETWTETGDMHSGRYDHAAMLMPNGQVMIVGGSSISGYATMPMEFYDPASGTWTSASGLNPPRTLFTVTMLPNGKVLVAGGVDNVESLNSTET
jgi:N-acetylneuraminic acid mutarotase